MIEPLKVQALTHDSHEMEHVDRQNNAGVGYWHCSLRIARLFGRSGDFTIDKRLHEPCVSVGKTS